MSRSYVLLSLAVVPFALATASFSSHNVMDVCSSCSYHTISDAIANAHAGDTVVIHPGIYSDGPVVIDKTLNLVGVGWPTLKGVKNNHVVIVKAPKVTIKGLRIIDSGMSEIAEFAGIRVDDQEDCQIIGNKLENNTYAIYLAHANNCLIKNNTIKGYAKSEVLGGNAIHLWSSKNVSVIGNVLSGHRDGIYIEFSSDSLIQGNVSKNNIRYGLHFMYSDRNRYFDNQFINNQTGVAVMFSRRIEMKNNRFEKSWGRASYGLLLKEISESKIEHNIFSKNTIGIVADGVGRSKFEENVFAHNGWGLNILGNSDDNHFSRNDFISNFFDAATNSMDSQNTFDGNYWSSYKGYDLNKDGVGDVPFRPMRLFSLWVNRYPELVVLLGSPVVEFLDIAERVLPILTAKTFADSRPSMKPFRS